MVGRADHHNSHAQPQTRRVGTSRTSDNRPRFLTQLQLHQRATLPPQGTLSPDNHPQPHTDHEGAMPRHHGTTPRRTGCVGTRYGCERTFRETCADCNPLCIWARVKLQPLATHYLSAAPSPPQLYRLPPGHVGPRFTGRHLEKDQILGSEGTELAAVTDLSTHGPSADTSHLWQLLVVALSLPLNPAAAHTRRPIEHSTFTPFALMFPGSNVTGGRVIGHDERFSDVLDATVDASESCTP